MEKDIAFTLVQIADEETGAPARVNWTVRENGEIISQGTTFDPSLETAMEAMDVLWGRGGVYRVAPWRREQLLTGKHPIWAATSHLVHD